MLRKLGMMKLGMMKGKGGAASRWPWGVVLACLLLVSMAALAGATEAGRAPAESNAPPSAIEAASPEVSSVEVLTIRGLLNLLQGSRGSVTVLNLWATWCKPCLEEMPELARFARTYRAKGVKFLSVSADHPDDLSERVRTYVEREELPFAVWVVGGESPEELAQAIDRQWQGSLPATFVFDASGTRRQAWYGKVAFSDLAGAVDSLLEEAIAPGGVPANSE